jgi:hypothetical protein
MKLRVKIGISTLLVFVIFIACWWSIEKTKRDAGRFFNKALLLQVDRSTVGDVLALVMVSGGTSY